MDKIKRLKGRLRQSHSRHQSASSTRANSPAREIPSHRDQGILPSSGYGHSNDTVYEGFKTTLRVVKESSDVFSPLKSVVGGLLGLIEVLENARRNEKDSVDLEKKIWLILSIMSHSKDKSGSKEAVERMEQLSESLANEVMVAKNIQFKGSLSKAANATKDHEEIMSSYHRISEILDMFLVETTLAIEKITVDTHATASKHYLIALLDKLQPVESAMYNAESPVPRRACTDNTRREILQTLVSWALDKSDKKIYYLNGMAGTGKTTLAYTFSQILDRLGLLGGTFFCSRADHSCSDASRIASTLASQLARFNPTFCEQLTRILDENAGRPGENIDLRFSNLIVKPSKACAESLAVPIVVIIDALDECRSDSHVLTLMHNLWSHAPDVPVKFFVTSRPERPFHDKLYGQNDLSTKFHLHNVEASLLERDIRRFLEERLQTIADEYRSRGLPVAAGWPPERELNALTRQSGKLFIYAATACQYIGGSKLSLSQRLTSVVKLGAKYTKTQTEPLDLLYTCVLDDAYDGCEDTERSSMNQIVGAVVTAMSPLSVSALADLLRMDPGVVKVCLSLFHSVLNVSTDDDFVTTLHASFPDYLSNSDRSQRFFSDPLLNHSMLANLSLNLMADQLRENICKLEGRPDNDLILKSGIEQHISPALHYACVNWPVHACSSGKYETVNESLKDQVFVFFESRSLMWAECLSYIGALYKSIKLLRSLEGWVSTADESLSVRILDIRRSISLNIDLASKSALELYNSLFIWLPETSYTRQKHGASRNFPDVVTGLPESWNPCEMVLTGHKDSVNKITFSPDGTQIASCSNDGTARIWDSTTGGSVHVMTGHSDYVNALSFSPYGTQIATGSDDKTIRVWNTITSESEHEFIGHSGPVGAVTFSPDGTRIASASKDCTVRVWDMDTGRLLYALVGHSGSVSSIAFSGDEARIASSGSDGTVRLWSANTGQTEHVLTGHSDQISKIAFSRDGTWIASGSDDRTVRVWNTTTGKPEQQLVGHSGPVWTLDYSADGILLGSGSDDCTVRIWNMATGKLKHLLTGHTGLVSTVVFSPDGTRIASGSDDKTVRVWNSTTGEVEQLFTGHVDDISAVIFSPDGTQVVSASYDSTIQIWNANTNKSDYEWTGHSDEISTMIFSPDGALVASGSEDTNVRVWNTNTGKLEHVLTGHGNRISTMTFSQDGVRIASGSEDNTVRVWNATTGKSEVQLVGHSDEVTTVSFSPDGARIASGSEDKTVRLWNVASGQLEHVLAGHSGVVNVVTFSPDGSQIASGSNDKTVRIWNAGVGNLEHELTGPQEFHWIVAIAFSQDGTRIAAKDTKAVTLIWNATSMEIVQDELEGNYSDLLSSLNLDGSGTSSLIHIRGQWLIVAGTSQKYWIPPAYHSFTTKHFHSNKLALGYRTGRVIIIVV